MACPCEGPSTRSDTIHDSERHLYLPRYALYIVSVRSAVVSQRECVQADCILLAASAQASPDITSNEQEIVWRGMMPGSQKAKQGSTPAHASSGASSTAGLATASSDATTGMGSADSTASVNKPADDGSKLSSIDTVTSGRKLASGEGVAWCDGKEEEV